MLIAKCIIVLFIPAFIYVYEICGIYNDVDKLKKSVDRKD